MLVGYYSRTKYLNQYDEEKNMSSEPIESQKMLANAIRSFLENPNDTNIKLLRTEFAQLKDKSENIIFQELQNIIKANNIVILPHHIELIYNKLIQKTKKNSNKKDVEEIFLDAARSYYPLDEKAIKVRDHLIACIYKYVMKDMWSRIVSGKNNINKQHAISMEAKINLFFENRCFYSAENIYKFVSHTIGYDMISFFSNDEREAMQKQLGNGLPLYTDNTNQVEAPKNINIQYSTEDSDSSTDQKSDEAPLPSLLSLRKTLKLPKTMENDKKQLLGAINKLKSAVNMSDGSSLNLDSDSEISENDLARKLTTLTKKYTDNWEMYDKDGPKQFENKVKEITGCSNYPNLVENIILACIPIVGWGLLIGKGLCALENTLYGKPVVQISYSDFFRSDTQKAGYRVKNAAESLLKYTPTQLMAR